MIRVGIIGAGHFGAAHARAIAEADGVELVAACRNDANAIAEFASEFGCRAYVNQADLLADPDIDAVMIALPHHLHEASGIAAARAGKHILMEKPIGHTAAASAAINRAVAAADVTLAVGHVMHFMRYLMVAKELISSGDYGKPLVGNSRMIKMWMQGNRRDWHLDPQTGGGMLMTAGIHMLDAIVWLMGSPVASVSALTSSMQHDQQVDDTALISLRFVNGGLGQVQSVGYVDGAPTTDIDIVCEKATIKADAERGVLIGQNGQWTAVPGSTEPNPQHCALIRQWISFRRSVEEGADIAVDGAYAAHLVDIVETILVEGRASPVIRA